MANDVNNLIDMLYRMIDEAKSSPLSQSKCTVGRDEALDLIDEIRAQLPIELKRAQELLRAREEYVETAKRDVDRMMHQADLDAKAKVSESEILNAARQKGRAIVQRAEERSREMYRVANEYTEDALRRTEEAITMAQEEIRQSRANFRTASAEKMQQQKEKLDEQELVQKQAENN